MYLPENIELTKIHEIGKIYEAKQIHEKPVYIVLIDNNTHVTFSLKLRIVL